MSDNPLSSKVGLDTTEFKTGVAQMNRELRVLESSFRANAASLGNWGQTASGLEMRSGALTKKMDVQQRKVEATRREYERIKKEKGETSRAAQDLEIKLNRETETLGKMQVELKDSEEALGKMGKEAQNSGKKTEELSKDTNKATTSTNRFKTALGGLGGVLRSTAGGVGRLAASVGQMALKVAQTVAMIAGTLVVAIGGLLASTVTPASDLNETVSKVGVVFGDAADQVLEFGQKAATGLGMSQNEALAAAGTYGNLFRSMGMTNQASADMSIGLVTLAGDLASFNNMEPTEVLDKLRAGLTGETEPLKTLGVNLNAAQIKARALEMGFKLVNGELTAAAKAQASYSLIMEQTALAQGDFARTSEGLANQKRILRAQIENLRATIGTGLLPVLAMGSKGLNSMLASPAVQNGAQRLSDALAGIGTMLSGIFGGDKFNIQYGILTAVTNLAQVFGLTREEGTRMGLGVLSALGPLGATIQRVMGYFTELFSIITGSGGDMGKMGEGIGGLIATIFGDTATARAGMLEAGLGLLQGLVSGILGALPTLLPMALQLITSLVQFFVQSLPLLVQAGIQIVMALVNGILPMLPSLIEAGITLLVTLATGIAQALPELIPAVVAIIPQIITILIENLPLLIDAALQLILALASGLIAALPILIESIPTIVKAIFDALIVALPMIGEAALQLIMTLIDGIMESLPMLGEAAGELIGALVNGIGALGNTILSVGENLVMGVWDGISARAKWFENQVMGFFRNIVDKVKQTLGIESPSTVMADSVGEPMAEGVGVGFVKQLVRVRREMVVAIGGLSLAPHLASPLRGEVQSGGGQSTMVNLTVHLNVGNVSSQVDVREMAYEVAYIAADMIQQRARR